MKEKEGERTDIVIYMECKRARDHRNLPHAKIITRP